MQFHVDMISVFSSGPLTQIMINCTPGFLEGVCNPLSLLCIWLIIPSVLLQLKWTKHPLSFIIEEMKMALLQL